MTEMIKKEAVAVSLVSYDPQKDPGNQQQPTTTSLLVAEVFDKDHKKVLRDIRGLFASQSEKAKSLCGANFGLTSTEVSMPNGGTRTLEAYTMTEAGFMFLVMGWQGEKADECKAAFILEFERMRKQESADRAARIYVLTRENKHLSRCLDEDKGYQELQMALWDEQAKSAELLRKVIEMESKPITRCTEEVRDHAGRLAAHWSSEARRNRNKAQNGLTTLLHDVRPICQFVYGFSHVMIEDMPDQEMHHWVSKQVAEARGLRRLSQKIADRALVTPIEDIHMWDPSRFDDDGSLDEYNT